MPEAWACLVEVFKIGLGNYGKIQTLVMEAHSISKWSALVGADHLFIPLRRAGA